MRVLLISANQETEPYPVYPIGLASIASSAKKSGHNIQCIDMCFDEDNLSEVLDKFCPEVIGISIRNVDNLTWPRSVSFLPALEELVKTCLEYVDKNKIVVGGSGYSLFPDSLLKKLGLTYGIQGEGEIAFCKFLECCENKSDMNSVPSLVQRKGDNFFFNNITRTDHLDNLPLPSRKDFHSKRYMTTGGMGNIQTKRGCGLKCIYCTYSLLDGSRIRVRSPELIVDEIESFLNNGMDYIYFVDDIFTFPRQHAYEICSKIIERRLKPSWTAFVNPSHVDEELLVLMKRAGCTGIEYGTEAGCNTMLRNMGKNFNTNAVKKAAELSKKAGLKSCHYLLFGGPGENRDTIKKSCEFIASLDSTAVIAMTGIRIYPQTRLYSIAIEEGFIAEDNDLLEPTFYFPETLEPEWMMNYIEKFSKTTPGWIVPSLGINTPYEILQKLRKKGIRGPLWELARFKGLAST